MERNDVAGIFDDERTASAAVEKLLGEHFGAGTDLTVMVSKQHEREQVQISEPIPAYRAAAIGAGLGALVAALIVGIAGIGFGPFTLIEWGPLWAIFEAAYTGGAVGMALGALVSIEMIHPKADFESVKIRDGVVWVGLHASAARADRAREILTAAGARHVVERDPRSAEGFGFRHAA
jgi:hypothetical protein